MDEDRVNTLIVSIIKNFVGDPITFQEKTSKILMNFHYRKLTDFRWYKDNYHVKSIFWFLGLGLLTPTFQDLTAKKLIGKNALLLAFQNYSQKLRESFNNPIPYQNLTYGDLINYINKE
uniref:Uncharacterized protein n=1 Tax=Lactuca sativa TaxID=4236 RepID=A0A9R1UKS0_LACSA|nr:hypothetical protein LSAT_V11C800426240 [Lactuca sativa]